MDSTGQACWKRKVAHNFNLFLFLRCTFGKCAGKNPSILLIVYSAPDFFTLGPVFFTKQPFGQPFSSKQS
jgi:hypothetical protein